MSTMTDQARQLLAEVAALLDRSPDSQARYAASTIRRAVEIDKSQTAVDQLTRKVKSAASSASRKRRKDIAKVLGLKVK